MAAYIKHTTFSAGFNSSVLPKKNDTEQGDVFKARNNTFTGYNTFGGTTGTQFNSNILLDAFLYANYGSQITISPNTDNSSLVIKNKDITGSGTEYNSEVDFQDNGGNSKGKIVYDATNDRFELNKSLNLSSGSYLTAGSDNTNNETYVIFVANPVANFGAVPIGTAITGGSSGGNNYLICHKNNYTVKTLKQGSSDRQSGIYLTSGLWQVQLWIADIEETGSSSDVYYFYLDADSAADVDTAERITNARMYVAASHHTPPNMTHYVNVPDGDALIWACNAGTAFDPKLNYGGLTYAFRQVKEGTWNGNYSSTGSWTEYTGW